MRLEITFREEDENVTFLGLVDTLLEGPSDVEISLFQAPSKLDYICAFPIVSVHNSVSEGRHYGDNAVAFLEKLSTSD